MLIPHDISICVKYHSIFDFWRFHRLPSRKPSCKGAEWRLADMSVGQFRGLDEMNGVAVATDGMLLICEDVNGRLHEGHVDNWIANKQPLVRSTSVNHIRNRKSQSNQKVMMLLEEFL